jgi:hypothetical protein
MRGFACMHVEHGAVVWGGQQWEIELVFLGSNKG